MAKIRHIAIISEDPERLARFYEEALGMTITGRSKGDVWVTDGYIDVALIHKSNTPKPAGVDHFGIILDAHEQPAVYAKLKAIGREPINPRVANPDVDRPFVDHYAYDVDGNKFDLSTGKRDMDDEIAAMDAFRAAH